MSVRVHSGGLSSYSIPFWIAFASLLSLFVLSRVFFLVRLASLPRAVGPAHTACAYQFFDTASEYCTVWKKRSAIGWLPSK